MTGAFRHAVDYDLGSKAMWMSWWNSKRATRLSLLGMARMERELGEMLERKVDLRTAEDLSRYFRDEVVSSAVAQYARP